MIAFLIEGFTYANFFMRMVDSLPQHQRNRVIFFVKDENIFNDIKRQRPKCLSCLIPSNINPPSPEHFKTDKPRFFQKIESDIHLSFEYAMGLYLSQSSLYYAYCWNSYFATLACLNQYAKNIEKMYMCSGCGILSKPATLFCQSNNIPTRFIELSNLPESIFIDPKGTNALSSIAESPEILDSYPEVDDTEHLKWMKQYETFKQQPPAQSKNNALTKMIESLHQGEILNSQTPYLFLPLQVSNDIQLLLYSKYNNRDAILFAHELAKSKNLALVVKCHPAEVSEDEINAVAELQKTLRFILSQENTNALVRHAEEMVTINSTVGLEGLLYNKKVTILGRAFYKGFTPSRLKKYIHYYLFSPVNFFGSEKIPASVAERFFSR